MMGTEDKKLLCYCHWGWKTTMLADGSISYVGSITDQFTVKKSINYNDFVKEVFDRLDIDPSDKMLHFTVSFDRSKLIRLRDQEGVDTLLQFNNDGFAHVYASSLEGEPYSIPPSGGAKKVELNVVSDSGRDTTPAGNDLESSLEKARSNQLAGDSKPLKEAIAHQSSGDGELEQKFVVGDDDQKLSGVTRSCCDCVKRLNQNGVGVDVQNNISKIGTVIKQASRPLSDGAKTLQLVVYSDSEPETTSPDPVFSDFEKHKAVGGDDQKLAGVTKLCSTSKPDTISDKANSDSLQRRHPEFSDFEKHKAENRFAADQIWAVYDAHDAMPRKYVWISEVSRPEFKIKFKRLVPQESTWVKSGLPVGCGKFILGKSIYTNDRFIFSHQVHREDRTSDKYNIYPKKGEIWALFKDRKYKYEVVVILSDYIMNDGVKVRYLDKVAGFAGIFQRTKLTVAGPFFIKPKELYKFSHRIPSFKMIGTEGEGVPKGSFELDTAALPLDPNNIWYPGNVKEESGLAKSEPVKRNKSRKSEHATTSEVTPVPPGMRNKSRKSGHMFCDIL